MGKYIPVDPEKWAAMVIAQSDLVRYKEICDELDAECTRLKDENARLRSFCTRTIIPNIDLEKENARLKAEVDAWKDMVADSGVACNERARENQDLENQIERLKAEVERLTKAIDLTIIDLDERHERQDLRAWEFAELLRKAKGVQS